MKILRFAPILKQTLWGGSKIKQLKHLDTSLENIGESWELSGVAGCETICTDGSRLSLNQLVTLHKERLVGRHVYDTYADTFPLLVKFIDARQNLSIQVHPNDETAHRQNKERGKTEMWYLMASDENASVYSGLNQTISPEQYQAMVNDDSICEVLCRHKVKEGDVFFLPAGRIHAIGAGCFLVEIQQTSDVTYRIYDFKRKDKSGHYRQLHTKEAAEAIDYRVYSDYRTLYEPQADHATPLVDCPYFMTSVYDVTHPLTIEQAAFDSFVILIGLQGFGEIKTDDDSSTLKAGETLLIAAENKHIFVSGKVKFLEVHINLRE